MQGAVGIVVFVLLYSLHVSECCPHGYVHNGNSCYLLSHDTETWADAMYICTLDGGSLAEISLESENKFITSLVNGTKGGGWIGAADLNFEGEWRWWSTRTKLAYTNWRAGEPNNDRKDENCMQIEQSGSWNDLPCHQLMRYVCEMPDEITEIIG